ncbi:MAG: hypothetical protein H6Q65_1861 [Firmicutes bacterium]|nr:hypothetical protein [Bacillota bacterium]
MNKKTLTQNIKDKALALGFAKVGITTADDFSEHAEELHNRAPAYDFLQRPHGPLEGVYPRLFMPEAKSIICLVYDYSDIAYPPKLTASVGRAYLSRTYLPLSNSLHGARISLFESFLRENGCKIGALELPDRWSCARAGIITFGCNNFAYAEGCGSFIILKTILVDTELEYDPPTIKRPCPPNCRLCIDACPTGALTEPGKLIPQKCLGFNHWRAKFVPEEIRKANGTRIHGCDICQEVCPRNKKTLANATRTDPFLELLEKEFDLEKVLLMDDAYYHRVIHPIMYNYIRNQEIFQRNAAIALGNTRDERHVPALATALEQCKPIVREYAAWALGYIGGGKAKSALLHCVAHEQPENVKESIAEVLAEMA